MQNIAVHELINFLCTFFSVECHQRLEASINQVEERSPVHHRDDTHRHIDSAGK